VQSIAGRELNRRKECQILKRALRSSISSVSPLLQIPSRMVDCVLLIGHAQECS
jgi:hypothetical protein